MTSAVVPGTGTGMAADFTLFGSTHMISLAIVVVLSVGVCLAARGDRKHRLAWAIAILLIAQELAKLYVYVGLYGVSWRTSLPLDMCRLNEFLCAYLLVFRSYRAFEVAWFWSMGASVAALVTPDLAQGFPDPRYLLFFLGHGLVVLAALYAVFGYGFQPHLRSVGMALAASAVLVVIAGATNYLLDTNYLFLRSKPEAPSVLDLFGPWPYYVLGLFAFAVVACFVCYAPFVVARWFKRGDGSG